MRHPSDRDEPRDEYDFSVEDLRNAARGKYAERYTERMDIVPLDSESADLNPPPRANDSTLAGSPARHHPR
jgi:hypothetical protein